MRENESTQLNIKIATKNNLDLYKAKNKELIVEKYNLKRRMITNDLIIRFLLDVVEENAELLIKDKWRLGNVSKRKSS